ncbi:MAG: RNA polymerase factor sigma-54 [Spirochaetales bacterium]|nr:RNA polymerase factor sigma-54 [Spirochaetales bacterium]
MQIQKHEFRQEQRLKMSPQLFQAIRIMAMPIQELRQTIREEIEKNPALEIVEDRSADSYEEVSTQKDEEHFFEDTSDAGFISTGSSTADSKQRFLEGVLTQHQSLHDYLLWQLQLQVLPDEWYQIGELLILNLDDNGFHRESPLLLVPEDKKADLEKVMHIIQRFDPIGVCTSGYEEALLVQAEQTAEKNPLVKRIITECLPLLEKGKIKEVAKKLQAKESEVEEALSFIRTLEPLPGRNISSEQPKYVVPDIRVKIVEGEFVIVLNDEEIPVLGINPFFDKINDEAGSSKASSKQKDLRSFVSSNINGAKWFIRSINQRNETLLKTARAIIEFQRDFFRRGSKYLVPLTLRDISDSIGVHEATVSRITTGKYVQTEWGIFELKYFFTNSISGTGSGGSRFSKEGVKQIVKEIIEKEQRQLSDNTIVDILANRGIKIARRTVAKYRKELGIMSSFDRK